MRSRALLLLIPLVGCTFDGSARLNGGQASGDADPNAPDSQSFADAIASCVPNATLCVGDTLETCAADGMGINSALAQICDFACVDNDHCVAASNLTKEEIALCDGAGNSLALTPDADATVSIVDNSGIAEIHCDPDCGDGDTTVIPAAATIPTNSPDLAMFCISLLDIPAGLELTADPNLASAVALVVQGSATIAGVFDFSGGDASQTTAGSAGPGGGSGGALTGGEDEDGLGLCPGSGGKSNSDQGSKIGSGGGGGAFGGDGGNGGRGKTGNNGATAVGGAKGIACGNAELLPLHPGSGGGSGGDGSNGTNGWPGGGGAGALQISSKVSILGGGSIVASGGDGFFTSSAGGGGGGGSGGGVLLEAPLFTFSGDIDVDGGDGADGGAGNGGKGGTADDINGKKGRDESGTNESGAGGGGGGGRVRLNATTLPTCGDVTPVSACTGGTMALP